MKTIKSRIIYLLFAVISVITLSMGIVFAFVDFSTKEGASDAASYSYTIEVRSSLSDVTSFTATIGVWYRNLNGLSSWPVPDKTLNMSNSSYQQTISGVDSSVISLVILSAEGNNAKYTGSSSSYTAYNAVSSSYSNLCTKTISFEHINPVVTFNKQSGTGGTYSIIAIKGDPMPDIILPTRENYEFLGYYTGADGRGIKYYNADGTSAKNCEFESDITLYAYWKDVTPSVLTLSLEGGNIFGNINDVMYSSNIGSSILLPNPTRKDYNFVGWELQGDGSLKGARANYSQFTETAKVDSDGTMYTNYHLEVSKPSVNDWRHIQFPSYSFINGHEYRLDYQIRVNKIQGNVGFSARFSRCDNDYLGKMNNFLNETNGWLHNTLTQKLTTTFLFDSTEKITSPGLEIYTLNLKDGNTDVVIIDFDIKNITFTDLSNNTLAWSAQEYIFGEDDGKITALWTEKIWEEFAAESYDGGSGTSADPYQIATPEQLALLAKQSRSSDLNGKYFKQTKSINLNKHPWVGIGSNFNIFRGIYNGGFCTISGMKINSTTYAGLFSRADATIQNLIINDCVLEGDYAGVVLGYGYSWITNVIVDNAKIKGNKSAGGIAGCTRNSSSADSRVISCIVKNSIIEGSKSGSIIGGDSVNPEFMNITDCGVIDTTINGDIVLNILNGDGKGNITSSYGCVIVNSTSTKVMYGDSTSWGNWSYTEKINENDAIVNEGYPVQSELFWIGGQTGSVNVYNYLKNTLGFSEE